MESIKTGLFLLAVSAIFATVSACGHSNNASVAPVLVNPQSGGMNYLQSSSLDPNTAIPAPPVLGQAQDQADLAQLVNIQNGRTPADCDRGKSEVRVSLDTFFGPVNGPLTAHEVSVRSAVFERIYNDANYFVKQTKEHWNRPRAYTTSTLVHPCLPLDSTASYPSGHATSAYLFAMVLEEIDPSKKTAIEARADQIAKDRVLGGLHYPSDVAIGQVYAAEIYQALKTSPRYQADIASLKKN